MLLSFVARINAAKRKEQSAKKPSLESIVNGFKVVLDFRNNIFKEVMHDAFRNVNGKESIEGAIPLALQKLKQAASNMLDDTRGDDEILFAYDSKQHCLCVVNEEEAIKSTFHCSNHVR